MWRDRPTRFQRGLGSALLITTLIAVSVPRSDAATGGTITVLQMPDHFIGRIDGLSCPSAGDCVAVGVTEGPILGPGSQGATVPAAAIESLGQWSTFQGVTDRAVDGQHGFGGISCWAVGSCIAIGLASATPRSEVVHQFAYRLDGVNWTEIPMPSSIRGKTDILGDSISCVAPGVCHMLGLVTLTPRGAVGNALVYTWNEGRWHTRWVLIPPNTTSLQSVSCYATTGCAALLSTATHGRSPTVRMYLDRLGATGWRRVFPDGWSGWTGGTDGSSLICLGPSICDAVGTDAAGIVLSQETQGWGLDDVIPNSKPELPASLACAPTDCVVTSEAVPSDEGGGPLVGQWPSWVLSNGGWQETSLQIPSPLVFAMFAAASCGSASCALAGFGNLPSQGGGFTPSVPIVSSLDS